jgi:hypothetical protein
VWRRWTTRCCSLAGAAALASSAVSASVAPRPLLPLTEAWAVPLDSLPVGAPAGDAATLVIALQDGTVRAFAVTNGQPLWQAPLAASQPPTLEDRIAYVESHGQLTALTSADGTLRWQVALDAPAAVRAVVRAGWVALLLESGAALALDARDGRTVWRRPDLGRAAAAPTLAADRVYVPLLDGRVVSLNLADGRPIWEQPLTGRPTEILALPDRLYVGSSGNFFYCLAARDGRILWRWRTGADVIGPAVFGRGHVYFAALDNMLRALDWRSGVQQWARPLAVRPSASPWLVGEAVMVPALGTELPLFAQRNGRPAGSVTTRAELVAPPLLLATPEGPALVLVTGEEAGPPRLRLLEPASDPPLVPLTFLPGAPRLEPRLVPLDFWPGRPLPALPPPGPSPAGVTPRS